MHSEQHLVFFATLKVSSFFIPLPTFLNINTLGLEFKRQNQIVSLLVKSLTSSVSLVNKRKYFNVV